MSTWSAHVQPHGPLTQLAPRIWQVTGTANLGLPRNMTIWRMEEGGLWIHSAVACDDATMAQIEALGPPTVLVVPNGFHRLDAAVWKARYPALFVVCPEDSRKKVEQVVKVDGLDTEVLGVNVHAPPGLKHTEHVYELDVGAGQALVVCDALFNLPHLPGFGGVVLRLAGSTGAFGMTRVGRFVLLEDAKAYRGWLQEMAEHSELAMVAVAHGEAVLADAARKLKEAAARL
ncbi:MAG: hypothetical protein Q8P18_09385 [Pseudomonadota bacterium]|nr:hypothetical protein [Pseudomonadota bacterium]